MYHRPVTSDENEIFLFSYFCGFIQLMELKCEYFIIYHFIIYHHIQYLEIERKYETCILQPPEYPFLNLFNIITYLRRPIIRV